VLGTLYVTAYRIGALVDLVCHRAINSDLTSPTTSVRGNVGFLADWVIQMIGHNPPNSIAALP